MRKIFLEKNTAMDVTVVSNFFLDEYMPKANGEYVKIYLHLLRCCSSSSDISINSIADVFEYTEKDVMRALTYWEQLGILSLGFDSSKQLERITLKDVRADAPVTFKYLPSKDDENTIILNIEETNNGLSPSSELIADETPAYTAPKIKDKRTLSPAELTALTSDDDIKQLLYISQTYLGKTLSPSDTNTILYFYDGLHFSVELIEFLIEYCVSNNHKSLRYIEKVALEWAMNDIVTIQDAKELTSTFSSSYYPVLKAFGITGRNPAAIEKAMIDKWINEYGFSMDIIVDACNKTIATISTPSFKYADSILQRWKKKNVSSLADIKQLDLEHTSAMEASISSKASKTSKTKPTTFNSFPQRSYDYNELERQLLHREQEDICRLLHQNMMIY